MSVQILDPQMGPGVQFTPNSWAQQRFLMSDVPELLYSGRLGSSKSRTICEKADYLCRKYPSSHVVLSRKKREHMGTTTLKVLLEEVITPAHREWGWRVSADGGSTLFYPNGSQILAAGLDNPSKLMSGQFNANYTDQCEELDDFEWKAIKDRLRLRVGPYRQMGGACNPGGPEHHLFKRFRPDLAGPGGSWKTFTEGDIVLDNGEVVKAGTIVREVIMAGRLDNLENLPSDYLLQLKMAQGRYRDRYVLGLWVAYEGTVYSCWHEPLHVVDRPVDWRPWGGYPPPDWRRYRAIDFGYVNPFVCQWWARSPVDDWFMYREIYMTGRTYGEHAGQINRLEQMELMRLNQEYDRRNKTGEWPLRSFLTRLPVARSVADHDAEGRADLNRSGVATSPAVKDKEAGIQTVFEMMRPYLDHDGRTTTRLRMIRDALVEVDESLQHRGLPTCTREEVPLYHLQRYDDSETEKARKEEPAKVNDHGLDGMRYLLHTVRAAGPQNAERLVVSYGDDD